MLSPGSSASASNATQCDPGRLYLMKWVTREFGAGQIDRAGRNLVALPAIMRGDLDSDLAIVENWRSCHGYPLHALTMTLRRRVNAIDQGSLVAQRLKRLSSITAKLEREPNMKLSQMHDIGGCRAVVQNTLSVDALVARFEKGQSPCWEPYKKYDYIKYPKPDGYRSVHLVYRYCNRHPGQSTYNKLRIELQIRSRLQHAWATALETVDTFTRQALKANRGDADWQRFFSLMGHSIAIREGRSPVAGMPTSREELIAELRYMADKLKVVATLEGLTAAITTFGSKKGHFFLLNLDLATRRMRLRTYPQNQAAIAAHEYSELEKKNLGDPDIQTVLVSVKSLDALRDAYPNYYMDTSAFLLVVKEDIGIVPI